MTGFLKNRFFSSVLIFIGFILLSLFIACKTTATQEQRKTNRQKEVNRKQEQREHGKSIRMHLKRQDKKTKKRIKKTVKQQRKEYKKNAPKGKSATPCPK